MNRKKQVISAALSLLLSTGISAGSILPTFAAENDGPDATANEEQKGVAIDEKNFPDYGFRSYVKREFDTDENGYLSDEELEKARRLDANGDNGVCDIRGAEIFPNLKEVIIDYPCFNFDTMNQKIRRKLRKIYASDIDGNRIINLTNSENLEELDLLNLYKTQEINMSGCKNLKNIDFEGCENLQKVNLTDCKNLTDADFSDCDKLKTIDLSACRNTLSDLNLRDCKNLKEVDLEGCKELTSLYVDGCDNLHDIDIEFLKEQSPKLSALGLNSPAEKSIDLTGYKLNCFILDNGSVESIQFDKDSNLYDMAIGQNDIKELDLDGIINTKMENDEKFQISIQRQTPTITITDDKVKDNTVKISDLFSDASRVTIKKGSGYTYDNSAKTITFKNAKNMKFNYVWDTKYEDEPLYGTANIVVEEAPKPAQPEIKIRNLTKVTLATTKYIYDGKDKTPAVTAYDGTTRLDNSVYTVTYPTSRKNIGTYTVKVTGKTDKNCKGTATATYQIVPKTVNTPTVKAGKKKVTVKWSKTTGGVKYQLAIAKKGSAYKNYTVTSTSKTIKKLTSKKNYQIKVRAYKKVGIKTYYGGWSKSKTVKVK